MFLTHFMLNEPKKYLNYAEKVSDPVTKSALTFLAYSSMRKITPSKNDSIFNNNGNSNLELNTLYDKAKHNISKAHFNDTTVVKDILALEPRISLLGINPAADFFPPDEVILANFDLKSNQSEKPLKAKDQSHFPSSLGESFMVLPNPPVDRRNIPSNNDINRRNSAVISHAKDVQVKSTTSSKSNSTSNDSVEQLLAGMHRLQQENTALVQKVNLLLEAERLSAAKQGEIEQFKRIFALKYEKLRNYMVQFADKYGPKEEPVIRVEHENAKCENADSNSQNIVKQLEQTLKATLQRLSKLQKVVSEKEAIISYYEKQSQKSKVSKDRTSKEISPVEVVVGASTVSDGVASLESRGTDRESSQSKGISPIITVSPLSTFRRNPSTSTFTASLNSPGVGSPRKMKR